MAMRTLLIVVFTLLSIAAALLQVAAAGNIRTKTLRAFDEGEMQTLLGKLG